MENKNIRSKDSFIKNLGTSKDRNIRIEVTGKVSEAEKNFLDGMSFFTAGTLGKNSEKHLIYVSGIMTKMVRFLSSAAKGPSQFLDNPLLEQKKEPATETPGETEAEATETAAQIKLPTHFLVRNIGNMVKTTIDVEKAKGTRPDLILTAACGALALSMVKIRFLMKISGMDIPKEDFSQIAKAIFTATIDDPTNNS
ncbi:MAG: hypothetical protein Q7R35_17885 [Elusimicrobiota bacterium]|nr:hypothetical protein [Elusimicrobiota bacterium]